MKHNLSKKSEKAVKKYGDKIAPYIKRLFEDGESYWSIPIYLEIDLSDFEYLQRCSKKVADIIKKKQDHDKCQLFKKLESDVLNERATPKERIIYLQEIYGIMERKPEPDGEDESLGEMFENLVKHLPK